MIAFAHPWALGLAAAPLIAAAWRRARRSVSALEVPELPPPAPTAASRLAALPGVLAALAFAAGAVALAGPRRAVRRAVAGPPGVAIAVALDVSGSMAAEDFQPHDRLDVARSVVADFIRGRPDDPIALLAFAGNARTVCPATEDHASLLALLAPLDGSRFADGTAIGNAIATAVSRLKALPARSRVMVLVTDGANNAGQVDPDTAAGIAAAYGVRIHTVAVGKGGRVPITITVRDPATGRTERRRIEATLDVDEGLLRRIAARTGGRFFRATDSTTLRGIFEAIDAMEKSPAPARFRIAWEDLSRTPTFVAAAALLLSALLRVGPLRLETEAA